MYSVTGSTGKRWSAEKIERVERRAERLGDLERFVVRSPLFPVMCVVAFYGFIVGAHWAVETFVGWLLG